MNIKTKPVRTHKKGDNMNTPEAMNHLKNHREYLTKQQHSTIKGQILAGNIEGAMKGLQRLMRKKVSA